MVVRARTVALQEMIKFGCETTRNGRIGSIDQWGQKEVEFSTPGAMVYLRGGHIPHLMWENALTKLTFDQMPIYQLTLPSLFDSEHVIMKKFKSAMEFCGMPTNVPVHLAIHDPLLEHKPGFNSSQSVAIWSRKGKITLTAAKYREVVRSFGCDSFETLFDNDCGTDATTKRLAKAVDRTQTFYRQLLEQDHEVKGAVLASLTGGYSAYYRRKCAVDIGKDVRLDAYNVDLHNFDYGNEVNRDELKKLIEETFDPLPKDRLRYTSGAFDPTIVLFLVKCGLDLFDTSFAIKLAEEGKIFALADNYPSSDAYSVLNFDDENLATDFSPPAKSCQCYTCKNYTKGYLRHLKNTQELLFPLLLTIHNVSEYLRMFKLIRTHLQGGSTVLL